VDGGCIVNNDISLWDGGCIVNNGTANWKRCVKFCLYSVNASENTVADDVTDQQHGRNNNIDMDNIQPTEHDESVDEADQTSFIDLQSQVLSSSLLLIAHVQENN